MSTRTGAPTGVAAHRDQSTPLAAIADAAPRPFWLDSPNAPAVHPALVGEDRADLLVVGGGFTGLWTALIAKERDPDRDVVLIERESCPSGASGRNGGFMLGCFVDYFMLPRYEGQEQALTDLAYRNRADIEQALATHGIDCDLEPNGWIVAGVKPWHLRRLKDIADTGNQAGMTSFLWDQDEVQAAVHSPELLGGVFQPDAIAIVHPGKLAWGLKHACEQVGVRFFEGTPATTMSKRSGGARISTPYGAISAEKVALATYAHPSLARSLKWWRIPLYSHVLATEPLTSDQLAAIGWEGRQGIIDLVPFLYYYRLTHDNRIIWGHVDATLHRGRSVHAEFEQDHRVFAKMARDFHNRFPQLDGIRFTHRWGGALDTTSRAAPFFGTLAGGRVAYANGYMAGVGASHAGATIMLDLLAGARTPYTEVPLVSGPGIHGTPSLRPYPPEPFLSLGMAITRVLVAREQETGNSSWLTRLLSAAGFIF